MDEFSSDSPKENPEEDVLGYADFSRHLAKALMQMRNSEGFVVALNGRWGSGKSTVLNFVEHHLNELDEDENERPIIIRFNPWWFSGESDLRSYFLSELRSVLVGRLHEMSESLGQLIADLGKLISKAPVPGTQSSGEFIHHLFDRKISVDNLRKKIIDSLDRQGKRIIVFIDDIDRLTASEIRQLFGLVKGVADFPTIMYLMAFDREVVTSALDSIQNVDGKSYLEKIVQVSFDLPLPVPGAITDLLYHELEPVVAEVPDSLWDNNLWAGLKWQIESFFQTPRHVVRFLNAFSFTYGIVENEVNVVDLIVLEILRVFQPDVYETIRQNPEFFVEDNSSKWRWRATDPNDPDAPLRAFHQHWLAQLEQTTEKRRIEEILRKLFPLFERALYTNAFYVQDRDKSCRIGDPNHFRTFFRLEVGSKQISYLQGKTILDSSNSIHELHYQLLSLKDRNPEKLRSLLNFLLERFDDLASHMKENLIEVLLDLGDQFLGIEDKSFFEPFDPNETRMIVLIFECLRRLDPEERSQLLQRCLGSSSSDYLTMRVVVELGREHGRYGNERVPPEEQRLVDADTLMYLEEFTLPRIRRLIATVDRLDFDDFRNLLYVWKELESTEVTKWLEANVGEHDVIFKLLRGFSKSTQSEIVGININKLQEVVEPDLVHNRLLQLSYLDDTQQQLKNTFFKSYAEWHEATE